MGWVSCLEDAQKRQDSFVNSVQGLVTEIGSSTWYELNIMRRDLQDFQSQLDKLVEVVTDPKIAPKIELYELNKAYEQMKLENQHLQSRLFEEVKKNVENDKKIKETNSELCKMAISLQTELDISEGLTTKYEELKAKYYEEQNRREKAENELEKLKSVGGCNSSSRKKSNKK